MESSNIDLQTVEKKYINCFKLNSPIRKNAMQKLNLCRVALLPSPHLIQKFLNIAKVKDTNCKCNKIQEMNINSQSSCSTTTVDWEVVLDIH